MTKLKLNGLLLILGLTFQTQLAGADPCTQVTDKSEIIAAKAEFVKLWETKSALGIFFHTVSIGSCDRFYFQDLLEIPHIQIATVPECGIVLSFETEDNQLDFAQAIQVRPANSASSWLRLGSAKLTPTSEPIRVCGRVISKRADTFRSN